MKLYATVTSERASKGQGGEYLDIVITDSQKIKLWQLNVTPSLNLFIKQYINGRAVDQWVLEANRGEKQKGEHSIGCCKDHTKHIGCCNEE